MSEQLASLHKKGGRDYGVNLFFISTLVTGLSTWTKINISAGPNNPTGTTVSNILDDSFGHLNDGSIIVDKAISKVYISGQSYAPRNASGTRVYCGIRIKKNGTVIPGASAMGNSTTVTPNFFRVETSLSVGDELSIECNLSGTPGNVYYPAGVLNIVTD